MQSHAGDNPQENWPRDESDFRLSPMRDENQGADISSPPPPPPFPGQRVEPPRAPEDVFLASKATASESPTPEVLARRMEKVRRLAKAITHEVAKAYVGQEAFVRLTLTALLSGGHVLIESVPGLGKTLLVRTLGQALGCHFARIQFTADLMPSDITGQPIFDLREQQFVFRPGPVFAQILLADEINRAPAKTHAALLEIMQERRVTVDGVTHPIEPPFLTLATQNPVESEGTYNLPEAQLDRFMFKLVVPYPSVEEEDNILRLHCRSEDIDQQITVAIRPVATPALLLKAQEYCRQVTVDDRMVRYINTLVRRTREWPDFYLGASPRAGIAILQGARVLAACAGRTYIIPDDVIELVQPVLRHRVILTPEAEVEGRATDESLAQLVRSVEVPRL